MSTTIAEFTYPVYSDNVLFEVLFLVFSGTLFDKVLI